MSSLNEKYSYLWHAYDSLVKNNNAGVPRSQIKVLTQNISSSIGLIDIEKQWDNEKYPEIISFELFILYLEEQLNEKINSRKVFEDNTYFDLNRINDVSWLLCSGKYLDSNLLPCSDQFKLWCIFNNNAEFLDHVIGFERKNTETITNNIEINNTHYIIPICMHIDEANFLIRKIFTFSTNDIHSSIERSSLCDEIDKHQYIDFSEFISRIKIEASKTKLSDLLHSSILDIYEEVVLGIIHKGYLKKKGALNTWKTRWFTMTPSYLRWYHGKNNEKGHIHISDIKNIEIVTEKNTLKTFKFQITSSSKVYELSGIDSRSRNEWIKVIRNCMQTIGVNIRIKDLKQRQLVRRKLKQRCINKVFQQNSIFSQIEESKSLLNEEREARINAEVKLRDKSLLLEEERNRLQLVDEMNQELEKLLDLEVQAKEDEQIVRTIQSRMLKEEFEKREELERIQFEIKENLENEKTQRKGEKQKYNESLEKLEKEKLKLVYIEEQKKINNIKLKESLLSLEITEQSKNKLQIKMDNQIKRYTLSE